MLRFLKHEVSNYSASMGEIDIYSHLTNQLISQSTISEFEIYYREYRHGTCFYIC
jgi:hypothetical protein